MPNCLARLFTGFLILALIGIGVIPAAAQTTKRLRIALLTSSSSEDADSARHAKQGARLAIEVINAGSGILDPDSPQTNPIYFTFELSERSAPTAAEMRTALQAAIEDSPLAIVGPFLTTQANGNLDLANRSAIPHFLATSADPSGTGGRYTYRIRTRATALARDLATYLIRTRYYREIATAADDSTEATEALNAFKTGAEGTAAPTLNPAVTYSRDAADLSAPAQTLYEANPPVVAIFGTGRTAALMVSTLRAKGYTGAIVVYAPPAEFLARAEGKADDVILPALWWETAEDVGSARFAAAYRTRYGEAPTADAATAFDGVALIAGAVKVAGGTPDDILEAIDAGGVFGGVIGVYDPAPFTAGRLIETTTLFRLKDGNLLEESRFSAGNCVRNCGDTRPRDINALSGVRDQIVRIGFVAPQTGLDGEVGRRALAGAQLAVNEINTAGGILGMNNTRYKLDLRNVSAATSEDLRFALQGLVSASAAAILGPTLATPLLPNITLAPSARVPQLISASSSAFIATDAQPFIFQLRPADSIAAATLARYLTDIRGFTRLATAGATTNYAQDSIGAFNTIVQTVRGAELVAAVSHPVTETDFSANARLLIAAKPQVITLYTTPDAALSLIRALRGGGYTGLITYGAITNPDFLSALTSEDTVNLIGTGTWAATALDTASANFTKRFTETFREAPDSHAAAYYDGVYMLARVIAEGGTVPATIQANLARLGLFAGVQGEYRPGAFGRGQLSTTIYLFALADGALSEISRWQNGNCINSCY
ncbi:MAG TPA: ABC transporter substrate-binding protein [Aggregatilineales bacterium]|nr:amino acid ABC transporter substrate-binding protein [Anaerolineales bacterium]HRE46333.1 ABC transporter substrate-binding protein [Aggregatilineales bacterium]